MSSYYSHYSKIFSNNKMVFWDDDWLASKIVNPQRGGEMITTQVEAFAAHSTHDEWH